VGGRLTANSVRNKVADYFLTELKISLANVKNMNSRVRKMKQDKFVRIFISCV